MAAMDAAVAAADVRQAADRGPAACGDPAADSAPVAAGSAPAAAPSSREPMATWLRVEADDPEQASALRLDAVLRALI
jgi:hypothetical protein